MPKTLRKNFKSATKADQAVPDETDQAALDEMVQSAPDPIAQSAPVQAAPNGRAKTPQEEAAFLLEAARQARETGFTELEIIYREGAHKLMEKWQKELDQTAATLNQTETEKHAIEADMQKIQATLTTEQSQLDTMNIKERSLEEHISTLESAIHEAEALGGAPTQSESSKATPQVGPDALAVMQAGLDTLRNRAAAPATADSALANPIPAAPAASSGAAPSQPAAAFMKSLYEGEKQEVAALLKILGLATLEELAQKYETSENFQTYAEPHLLQTLQEQGLDEESLSRHRATIARLKLWLKH